MPVDPTSPLPAKSRSRLGLYLPFVLLVLLAVGWSVAWFVIRQKAGDGLDAWIAREAAARRTWSCQDRTIGGFPFRLEIGCARFTLARPDVAIDFGRLGVVAQVYQPSHVIAEISGPLKLTAGDTKVDASWRLFRTSLVLAGTRSLERGNAVVDEPRVAIVTPAGDAIGLQSRQTELHLRPSPGRTDTWDVALTSLGSGIPGLDALLGGTETSDLELLLDITQAAVLPARPLAAEFDLWRQAGGQVDLNRFGLTKGNRRVEGRGILALDEQHRIRGEIQASAVNLGGLMGQFLGPQSGLGRMLGAVLGGGRAAQRDANPPAAGQPVLRPLPPLRLADGQVFVGPLPIPVFRLQPLY